MKTWTTDSVKSVLTMLGSTGKKTWAIGSVNSVLMLGSTGMKVWTTGVWIQSALTILCLMSDKKWVMC